MERREEEKEEMIPKEKKGSLRNRIKVFLGLWTGFAFLAGVTIQLSTGKSWLYRLFGAKISIIGIKFFLS